jgi:hypothetical protein
MYDFFLKSLVSTRRRQAALIASGGIVILCLGVIATTIVYQTNHPSQNFKPLKTHAGLPFQPMETYADSLNATFPSDTPNFHDSSCPALASDWVKQENAKPGVSMTLQDWTHLDFPNALGSALWLNQTAVSCGDKLQIHASLFDTKQTYAPAGPRAVVAMRIGYYNGSGAREVWKSGPLTLKAQKVPLPRNATRMVETTWPTTLSVSVGDDWTPGFYLIATMSPKNTIENVAPLVVRAPLSSSPLLLVHSFMTWNMYNTFGGRSGYEGPGGTADEIRAERSRVISFDRPIVGSGAYAIHRDAIPLVQFLEQQGIAVDNESDVDVSQWPSITQSYNGVVLGGHAEYMTRRLFDTYVADRNNGINLAVLGGNTAYWQTRMASSPTGPMRRAIMYRSAIDDPVTDVNQVTVQFGDKRVNTPANLITGELTDGVHVYGDVRAVKIPSWLKLPSYASITGISPDTEAEVVPKNVAEAPQVNVLFSGVMRFRDPQPVRPGAPRIPMAQTSWFTTPSGAAVFDAGMTTWSCNLMESCAHATVDLASRQTIDSVTQQVLTLWSKPKIGLTLK